MEMIWIGIDLPYRPHYPSKFTTYSLYPSETLPPLPEKHRYSHIETLEDYSKLTHKDLPCESPTSCYWTFDELPVFFHDQQDCFVCAFDEKGVYDVDRKTYLEKKLGDFIYRIELENDAWYASHGYHFLNRFKSDDQNSSLITSSGSARRSNERGISGYRDIYKELEKYLEHYEKLFIRSVDEVLKCDQDESQDEPREEQIKKMCESCNGKEVKLLIIRDIILNGYYKVESVTDLRKNIKLNDKQVEKMREIYNDDKDYTKESILKEIKT